MKIQKMVIVLVNKTLNGKLVTCSNFTKKNWRGCELWYFKKFYKNIKLVNLEMYWAIKGLWDTLFNVLLWKHEVTTGMVSSLLT